MKLLLTDDLGRLARYLRLMGHDATLAKNVALPDLYRQAYNDERVVLTRNAHVSSSGLFRVVHIESPTLGEQLQQVARELGIAVREEDLFTRCDRCNVPVEPIDKAAVQDRVPPFVFETQQTFVTCPSCNRIYWDATHCRRLRATFQTLGS